MKTQEIKTLAPLYEEICKLNKFHKWKLEITYTPKQPSITTSDITITQNKDTFSGCIIRAIINLNEMQKWNISYYLKTRNNKITLRIYI